MKKSSRMGLKTYPFDGEGGKTGRERKKKKGWTPAFLKERTKTSESLTVVLRYSKRKWAPREMRNSTTMFFWEGSLIEEERISIYSTQHVDKSVVRGHAFLDVSKRGDQWSSTTQRRKLKGETWRIT